MPEDKAAGLLNDCGKTMPFVDTFVSTIDKEKVPRKEKFKQGFLDVPEIERPEWGVEFNTDMQDSDEVKTPVRAARLQVPARHRHQQLVPRFQLARPGDRQGRHAGSSR